MNPKNLTIEDALKMSLLIKSSTPLLDAQVLLCEATGLSKAGLYAHNKRLLTENEYKKYTKFIQRRCGNEPVAYITGHCEFMGLDFVVNYDTLIPRPDTEILTEAVISLLKEKKFKSVLDMCTGSGAIAVSVAFYCNADVTASDISGSALSAAMKNAENNGVNVSFVQGSIFENIKGKFDILVSNPPYVPSDVIPNLMPDVKCYEPVRALDGGKDGLYFYREITGKAREYLNDGGMIFFEIGYDQGSSVKDIMERGGFYDVRLIKDYSGLDRVLYGTKK